MPIIDIENSNLSREEKDDLISKIKQNPNKEIEILEDFKLSLENSMNDLYKTLGINTTEN
jgi:hypothetical protein